MTSFPTFRQSSDYQAARIWQGRSITRCTAKTQKSLFQREAGAHPRSVSYGTRTHLNTLRKNTATRILMMALTKIGNAGSITKTELKNRTSRLKCAFSACSSTTLNQLRQTSFQAHRRSEPRCAPRCAPGETLKTSPSSSTPFGNGMPTNCSSSLCWIWSRDTVLGTSTNGSPLCRTEPSAICSTTRSKMLVRCCFLQKFPKVFFAASATGSVVVVALAAACSLSHYFGCQRWSQPPLPLPVYRDDEYPPHEALYHGDITEFTRLTKNLERKPERRKWKTYSLFLSLNLLCCVGRHWYRWRHSTRLDHNYSLISSSLSLGSVPHCRSERA